MSKGDYLGDFEFLVLLAVLRLGQDAYGMTVRREIELRAGRPTPIGAVYTTLDRLEAKGLVTSTVGDPRPERGGRARRSFLLTSDGRLAIDRTHRSLASMSDGLDLGWGEA